MRMYYDARTYEYQTVKSVVVKGRNESIFIDRNNSQATAFDVTVRHGKFGAEIGRDLSEMKYCDISEVCLLLEHILRKIAVRQKQNTILRATDMYLF
jgi:hypothetical protein